MECQQEDTTMRFRRMSRSLLLPAGLAWAAAVAFGSTRLLNYEFMPGAAGTPSRSWPADPRSLWARGPAPCCAPPPDIRPNRRVPAERVDATLVMVAHPRCPCTRASIAELAHIMAYARQSVAAYVLFYRPGTFPPGWERTDLWRSAAAIPGVTVIADPDGRQAQRFGVVTSGHVLLYDRAGKLLFTGGITGSRGHAGDNDGADSVIRLLSHGGAARRHTCVYGCPIQAGRTSPGCRSGK
jgi:hypothetical protein